MDYTVHTIPLKEILSDSDFNCRGEIIPMDVLDLARSIEENGLQQPIGIQPYTKSPNPEHKYRIVQGHRRFMAHRINKAETIPAMIITDLDEGEAHRLNLIENIQRKDLNIVQEARGLKYWLDAGYNDTVIGNLIGKSAPWVNTRRRLLKLPKEIQEVAAAGILNQDQIKKVSEYKTFDKQVEFIRLIKEAKERGETTPFLAAESGKAKDAFKAKARKQHEINNLLDYIIDNVDDGIHTKVLAWAAGNISTFDVYTEIQKYATSKGITITLPPEIQQALKGAA